MLGVDDGIVNGNLNAADVLFLIGAILFGVGALVAIPTATTTPGRARAALWHGFLIGAGLCLVAIAWLIL